MSYGHAAAVAERADVRARMWIASDAGRVAEAERLRRRLADLGPFVWNGPRVTDEKGVV
jgi:hypothetical protein